MCMRALNIILVHSHCCLRGLAVGLFVRYRRVQKSSVVPIGMNILNSSNLKPKLEHFGAGILFLPTHANRNTELSVIDHSSDALDLESMVAAYQTIIPNAVLLTTSAILYSMFKLLTALSLAPLPITNPIG